MSQTSDTLLRWLLDGVVFGCAHCLDLCVYASRFVRLLFQNGVRDFESLMDRRGQFEW